MRARGNHIAIVGVLVGLFGVMLQQMVEPFTPKVLSLDLKHWSVIVWLFAYGLIVTGAIATFVGIFKPVNGRLGS